VTVPLTPGGELSLVVTSLMKGVLYADAQAKVWRHLLPLQSAVRDYVATVGLIVVIDETEGYAFLRQRTPDDLGVDDPEQEIPRLISRRSLSFPVSLLLALLRKRLAEFDATDSGTTCVLSRDQIVAMVEIFLPTSGNEARVVDQIDTHIGKVVDLGFLRKTPDGEYQLRRILKAFVDAQWLAGFDEGLREYAQQIATEPS
jgi:hypothetical protein